MQDQWHSSPECGCSLDSDHNVAINIKYLAVGHSVNKASGVLCNSWNVKREARVLFIG